MKGNKGEWSEIYTFLKLLADGIIYGGDEHLQRIDTVFYPLISIIREESKHETIYETGEKISVMNSEGEKLLEIDRELFLDNAEKLLKMLQNSKGSSFEFLEIEDFLKEIYVNKIKSSSTNKRDITLVVHDLTTNTSPKLGFSIKSRLGGNSTLLNPGVGTNFIYEVLRLDKEESSLKEIQDIANSIDSRSKIKDRTKFLTSGHINLQFSSIQSHNFLLNLQLIDSLLPEMIAEILLGYYSGRAVSMLELVSILEEENPLGFNQSNHHKFYEYKIKNFLTDVALGMTPQKSWTGHYDATGGYIIVKEDGDMVCYHIYNRNEFQNYLLNHTLLDTPSSTRYQFGQVYEDNGGYYYNLNLQIRFK